VRVEPVALRLVLREIEVGPELRRAPVERRDAAGAVFFAAAVTRVEVHAGVLIVLCGCGGVRVLGDAGREKKGKRDDELARH
jgi:hypothetical protein